MTNMRYAHSHDDDDDDGVCDVDVVSDDHDLFW